ncbi:zinc-ribbon domain-containing protein [Oceanobacillus sp. CFH 90083]|uniref:TcaA NTF2-like domain-containing protein n=1 Tax=Oceanobacillus sp. CFH 90083 TaxID=2592336 RepID=UPI0018837C8A|nr:zinc-ribbon domain-containing protein [Oceanobacillus sp. CFH 90083]
MSKFCRECGKPIADEAQFCKHCGTKVNKEAAEKKAPLPAEMEKGSAGNKEEDMKSGHPSRQASKEKKPMSKKKKILTGIIGLLILCGIGLGVWGNAYYSGENTAKRFANALAEGDADAIQNIVSMDGKELSDAEAQAIAGMREEDDFAFINDADPDGVFAELPIFEIEESDDKAFLFFTQYHVEAEPQYVTVFSSVEGVKTTFNGEAFAENAISSDSIAYGPLAPGVYEAASHFATDYGEAEKSQSVLLIHENNRYDSELEVGKVTFETSSNYNLPYHSLQLLINEEPLDIEMNEELVEAGPLLLDGSMEVTGMVETGWGDIQIDPIAITDQHQEIAIDLLNDQLKEEISPVIISFSEDYVEALAKQDASVIENISKALQETLEYDLFSNSDGNGFSGRLDEVGISFTDMTNVEEAVYEMPAQIKMTGTYDQDGDPKEIVKDAAFQLQYNEDDAEWEIFYFNENYYRSGSELEFYDVSGEEFEGVVSEDADQDENSDSSEDADIADIESLVENYVYDLVDAINTGDYGQVAGSIASGSDFEAMQQDLVERLYDNDLTQEVISMSVEGVEELDSETWMVTTSETIELTYASGSTETEDYQWTYTVELTNEGFQITNLE